MFVSSATAPGSVSLSAKLCPWALQGHEPGGVEEERVQVFGVDGPVKRRLRATLLYFRQQVLNLLDGNQDLRRAKEMIQIGSKTHLWRHGCRTCSPHLWK